MTVEPDAERANALCAASAKTTGHRYAEPDQRPAMASTSPHELCVPTAAPAASLLSHAHLHSTRPPLRVHRPRCAPVHPGRMWNCSQVSGPHRTIEPTDPVRFYVPNPLLTDTPLLQPLRCRVARVVCGPSCAAGLHGPLALPVPPSAPRSPPSPPRPSFPCCTGVHSSCPSSDMPSHAPSHPYGVLV